MCSALRDQCLVSLLKLWHRHSGILLFLRDGDIFYVTVFQHVRFLGIAVNHRNIAFRAGNFRLRFEDNAAHIAFDLTDEIRIDQEAAVRHHCVTACHLQRCERSRTQRQRLGMHNVLCREAETLQILCRVIHAHGAHGAYHHHVFRLTQPLT